MTHKITVTLSAFDAGCLPAVLEWRIKEVEQHMRVCAESYTKESLDYTNQFLSQIRGCLEAINIARKITL